MCAIRSTARSSAAPCLPALPSWSPGFRSISSPGESDSHRAALRRRGSAGAPFRARGPGLLRVAADALGGGEEARGGARPHVVRARAGRSGRHAGGAAHHRAGGARGGGGGSRIKEIAAAGRDPLAGPLRLGAIYTIGPYLLPKLIPILRKAAPAMQLHIQENFTHRLAEALKRGEVDVILVALPFAEPGVETRAVYDEPFFVAVPKGHPWETRKRVTSDELAKESLLLLGEGHCFRDQVLEICHTVRTKERSPLAKTVEGGSLETIRQMVAGGVGVTVLPATSVSGPAAPGDLIRVLPFAKPAPTRRVGLAWRKSFPRPQAIEALRKAILACNLPQVEKL